MKAIFVGGVLSGAEFKDVNDVKAVPCVGRTEDLTESRNKGELVQRAELDNQPIFKGYLEPMWNGDGLRYETQEVYNAMSI